MNLMNLWKPTYTNNQHLFLEWLQQVFKSITHPYTLLDNIVALYASIFTFILLNAPFREIK